MDVKRPAHCSVIITMNLTLEIFCRVPLHEEGGILIKPLNFGQCCYHRHTLYQIVHITTKAEKSSCEISYSVSSKKVKSFSSIHCSVK